MAELDTRENKQSVRNTTSTSQEKASTAADINAPAIDRNQLLGEMREQQLSNDKAILLNHRKSAMKELEGLRKNLDELTVIDKLSGAQDVIEKQMEAVSLRLSGAEKNALNSGLSQQEKKAQRHDQLKQERALQETASSMAEAATEKLERAETITRGVRNGAVVVGATIATGGLATAAAAGTFAGGAAGAVALGTLAGTGIGVGASVAEQGVKLSQGDISVSQAASALGEQTVQDLKSAAIASVGTIAGIGAAGKVSAQLTATGAATKTIIAASAASGAVAGGTASTTLNYSTNYIELSNSFEKNSSGITFSSPEEKSAAFSTYLKENGFTAQNIAIDFGANVIGAGIGATGQVLKSGAQTTLKKIAVGVVEETVSTAAALGATAAKNGGNVELSDFVDQAVQMAGAKAQGAAVVQHATQLTKGTTEKISVNGVEGTVRIGGTNVRAAFIGVDGEGKTIATKGNVALVREIFQEKYVGRKMSDGVTTESQARLEAAKLKQGVEAFYDRQEKMIYAPALNKGAANGKEVRAAFAGIISHEVTHARGDRSEVSALSAQISKIQKLGFEVEFTDQGTLLKARPPTEAPRNYTQEDLARIVNERFTPVDARVGIDPFVRNLSAASFLMGSEASRPVVMRPREVLAAQVVASVCEQPHMTRIAIQNTLSELGIKEVAAARPISAPHVVRPVNYFQQPTTKAVPPTALPRNFDPNSPEHRGLLFQKILTADPVKLQQYVATAERRNAPPQRIEPATIAPELAKKMFVEVQKAPTPTPPSFIEPKLPVRPSEPILSIRKEPFVPPAKFLDPQPKDFPEVKPAALKETAIPSKVNTVSPELLSRRSELKSDFYFELPKGLSVEPPSPFKSTKGEYRVRYVVDAQEALSAKGSTLEKFAASSPSAWGGTEYVTMVLKGKDGATLPIEGHIMRINGPENTQRIVLEGWVQKHETDPLKAQGDNAGLAAAGGLGKDALQSALNNTVGTTGVTISDVIPTNTGSKNYHLERYNAERTQEAMQQHAKDEVTRLQTEHDRIQQGREEQARKEFATQQAAHNEKIAAWEKQCAELQAAAKAEHEKRVAEFQKNAPKNQNTVVDKTASYVSALTDMVDEIRITLGTIKDTQEIRTMGPAASHMYQGINKKLLEFFATHHSSGLPVGGGVLKVQKASSDVFVAEYTNAADKSVKAYVVNHDGTTTNRGLGYDDFGNLAISGLLGMQRALAGAQ